jgi:hypothetical protein
LLQRIILLHYTSLIDTNYEFLNMTATNYLSSHNSQGGNHMKVIQSTCETQEDTFTVVDHK